jgi:polar amino acid transport system substrate-binding protein
MKRFLSLLLASLSVCWAGEDLTIGTSADAPPFEYVEDGEIKGFDISLGKKVAGKLGRKSKVVDIPFASLIIALENGNIDIAIASLNPGDEKRKKVDFSTPYYTSKMSVVFKNEDVAHLKGASGRRIACQLGTNGHEEKIKKIFPKCEVIVVDNLNQAIEAVKNGQADAAFMDEIPAREFCKRNEGLKSEVVSSYKDGYSIALKKGSPLTRKVNETLEEIKNDGEIEALEREFIDRE